MTLSKKSMLVVLGSLVAACDMPETATRDAPLTTAALEAPETVPQRSYDFREIDFVAPEELLVSEANSFYPDVDIVWRGDPVGDRKAQINSLFETALNRADKELNGDVPVKLEIELVRFHGVTERTRFTVGGNYDMHFYMTVVHADTGEILEPKRFVQFDLAAPGGAAAILLEQRGQTEKVRVTDFLTIRMQEELSGTIAL